MKPVMQSKLYQPDAAELGNCFAACLASLLELPLWIVPAFENMRADVRTERTDDWLERFFRLRLVRTDGHVSRPAHYIANGRSHRGVHHSVIYRDGELVHDPHPSGAGITNVEWTWHLEAC